METQEKEIIRGALRLFDKYGIRSVTMDDVAGELGMSKKTIYKFFKNKAELVHHCVMSVSEHIQECIHEIHESASNAIDELFDIDKVVRQILQDHNPALQFELDKYFPDTAKALYEGQHELIQKTIAENLENGQRSGLYRADFEKSIMVHLYCSKMETLPENHQKLMKKYSLRELMRQALEYHIRGIATPKGLEYLEQKLESENS